MRLTVPRPTAGPEVPQPDAGADDGHDRADAEADAGADVRAGGADAGGGSTMERSGMGCSSKI